MIRYVVRERVVRIRRAQQGLRKGRARCLREQRCMRCGVGRGSPGCSTIPSGSARLGSTCPSGYPDRCGQAGQCSDGKFWSGTGPGRAAAQAVSRSGSLRSGGGGGVWGVHKAAGAAGGEAGRTFGGAMGYSSGKKSSNLKMPSASEWRGGGWYTRGQETCGANATRARGPRRTLIRRRLRPSNDHVEVSQVVLVRCRTDAWRWRAQESGGVRPRCRKGSGEGACEEGAGWCHQERGARQL